MQTTTSIIRNLRARNGVCHQELHPDPARFLRPLAVSLIFTDLMQMGEENGLVVETTCIKLVDKRC